MTTRLLTCRQCGEALGAAAINAADMAVCLGCGARSMARVFPAFVEAPERSKLSETLLLDGESSCFYHPEKKASVPCDQCGRFLCALCDIDMNGVHHCPACLERDAEEGQKIVMQTDSIYYDSIALSLAILPILFFPATLFTPWGVIYIVIRYWRTPMSAAPRTHVRAVVALLIALAQLTGWGFLFAAMIWA